VAISLHGSIHANSEVGSSQSNMYMQNEDMYCWSTTRKISKTITKKKKKEFL